MCEGCEVPIHRTGKPVVNKHISFMGKKGGLDSYVMPSLTGLADWQKLQVWPAETRWGHGVMGTPMHACQNSNQHVFWRGTWHHLENMRASQVALVVKKRGRLDPWVGKILWSRKQPTPVFLPGKFHGQRSLVSYSPQAAKGQTQLSTHITSCICTLNLELYINDLILYIPSLVMLFLFCLDSPLAFLGFIYIAVTHIAIVCLF